MSIAPQSSTASLRRLRVEVRGAVQGVGFRPFVYRLARDLALPGWVLNDSRGVFVEVEGTAASLKAFLGRLAREAPPHAVIEGVTPVWLEPAGFEGFAIRHSEEDGAKTVSVLPDLATCPACLAEVADPENRRYRYPFTNCTDCGPRLTIVEGLPYDRPNTTMRRFPLCPECRDEYLDPLDRRFHAQPNACPRCGPRLELWDGAGHVAAREHDALVAAAQALRAGRIVAVKGLGGFHLMVDARDPAAVARLRRRKARQEKPLALMVQDLEGAARLCSVSAEAAALLASAASPIVLLPRHPPGAGEQVAEGVAPGCPELGLMLPATPLHHLLLAELGFPVVATSGNFSDEPIATEEAEALQRLGGIADLFLVHDRPIARHVDDSVVRFTAGAPSLLRRARGHAPLPVLLGRPAPTILAVGAHLKNAVALAVGERVFVSQHIGDLETPQALEAFERVIHDFLRLYEAVPVAIAHDLHPDYASTRWAQQSAREAATAAHPSATVRAAHHAALPAPVTLVPVQHHHAHLASCLAEHRVSGPALGVTWDGTGYGTDGTVWGGELLLGDAGSYRRVGRLRPFRLPGGEAAVREPRRCALALLWELEGEDALERPLPALAGLTHADRRLLGKMLAGGLRAPVTTSAGRLFDGLAALAGLRGVASFEGQAAMALEWAADPTVAGSYALDLVPVHEDGEEALELDWRPLVAAALADLERGATAGAVAMRCHRALAAAVVAAARHVGEGTVALSGGCFQNRLLTELAAAGLERHGFRVLLHRQVPANDGGISLGQVAVAAARLQTTATN